MVSELPLTMRNAAGTIGSREKGRKEDREARRDNGGRREGYRERESGCDQERRPSPAVAFNNLEV